MTVPVIADGARWIMKHLKVLLASSLYSNISDIGLMLGHYINWSLSLLFPGSENFNKEFTSGAWNIWIPLPECSHSLFDLWNVISSNARTSSHKLTLPSFLRQIWSLLKYPYGVINYVLPPFPAYGSIIGETHFISLDGRAFTMNSSCSHVLLADAKDKLFTLVSESHGLPERRSYTLFVGERIVKILPNLQVSADGLSITLPYVSDTISITRNLHHLTVASYDDLGRDLVTLSCLVNQQACVVGVSGWLLADTQGLLGHFNLNPADDFMRPSGQMMQIIVKTLKGKNKSKEAQE
ncbi:hypothetical protein SK128_015804 [Halocaridina rubra]|uniref:VWFD domain-containing protein n=1 Tax=Halocaridina rubra TaxID=373956 RepID=A0AAN8XD37_HALRR